MQGYFIYVVLRDLMLTLSNFVRGRRESFAYVIAMHYSLSCLDNIFMTGIAIWTLVAYGQADKTNFHDAAPETGLPNFLAVVTVNMAIAFLYILTHVCILPVMILIIAMRPERYGLVVRHPMYEQEPEVVQ